MRARPPFYRQAESSSCAVACLRMVLGSYGHLVPEPYLRDLCDCDETGTSPPRLVQAAIEHFNMQRSGSSYLNLAELKAVLKQGLWPIVYVSLSNLDLMNSHAVVVIQIRHDDVLVLDPALEDPGERVFEVSDFEHHWRLALGQTILIE